MGYYVNPPKESKETWLKENGTVIRQPVSYELIAEHRCAICLMDNGPFSAAAIIYDQRELDDFGDPTDHRPKQWFLVNRQNVVSVSDIELSAFK